MIKTFKCKRCDHEWATRLKTGKPQTCPKCRSPYWETKRRAEMTAQEKEADNFKNIMKNRPFTVRIS